MDTAEKRCVRCGEPITPGLRYCDKCGEAVDANLIQELRALYTTLRVLDEWIAAGKGNMSVTAMHADVLERYLALRVPPAAAQKMVAPESIAAVTAALASTAAPTSAPAAMPAAPPAEPVPPVAASRAPAFSWRAFLAEQAIAIMAYLGGFLLLVATLSFELGGWQVLGNGFKLAAVVAVYTVFGALGFAFRRSAHLGTVGRAYLAIFALMTPLVALAAYRFELQQSGFPPVGMLCLASAYGAVVYLLLAWRTSFATYAYLGWTALVIAALALVPWLGAPSEWAFFVLVLLALVLLAGSAALRLRMAAILREPALHLGTLASLVAASGTVFLGLLLWSGASGTPLLPGTYSLAAYASAASALVPLALMWSRVVRVQNLAARVSTDLVDFLVAVGAAHAAIAVAAALGADTPTVAYVLAALAIAEMGATYVLRWMPLRDPANLRHLIEGLALVLASAGAAIVWTDPAPNWPLAVALAAGAVVALTATIIEREPLLALVAGGLLTFAYHAVLATFLPEAASLQTRFAPTGNLPTFVAGLAMAEWCVATGLALRSRTKRYAGPTYLVALANALYASVLLSGHSRLYMTSLLLLFAIASLAATRFTTWASEGTALSGFFGCIAVLTCAFGNVDGVVVLLTAVVPALVALSLRRAFARRWAIAPYAMAVLATAVAYFQLLQPLEDSASWVALGIPYVAWVMFLLATLAALAAVAEDDARVLGVSALLALLGVLTVQNVIALAMLVFALAAIGLGWREQRGRWWSVAWYAAALLASPVAVLRLTSVASDTASKQVILLLLFAACAYLLAARDSAPPATALASLYGIAALVRVPAPNSLVPTVILTLVLAAAGITVRQGIERKWALAFYAVAVVGTVLSLLRIEPYDANTAEALLLVFAAVAYLAAALEREPVVGCVPALYAGAVVVVHPDASALLPLALLVGVLALMVSRVAGPRWAWPLYVVVAVIGGAAAALGTANAGFDAWALLALAVLAYVIAAVESRADLVPLALLLGGLALAECASARGWLEWQGVLAFTALAWAYFVLHTLWHRIPWLSPRVAVWWSGAPPEWTNPRVAGALVHRWGGLALSAGIVPVALTAQDSFAERAAATEVAVVALLSGATMMLAQARVARLAPLEYLAGELGALAITWQMRWLGAGNIQAFFLVPGSYQLLIGALLPADRRMGRFRHVGRWFSLSGSLVLLLPTLAQSFLLDPAWLYVTLLALEALLLVGIGAGTRSRLLVLTGSVFVGVAAIRGAALAVSSDVPIALVIAALALLLMAGATWLSLRARRDASNTTAHGDATT